jgi:hypothetical protein
VSTISYGRHERRQGERIAAVLAATGFVALGVFQLVLALGAPFGHAAWGGDSTALTSGQRFGSAVSVVSYAAAAALVLARVGLTKWPRSVSLLNWGPWLLAVLLVVGALSNFASQSHWESYLLGPVAIVLAALCAVVAHARQAQ